MTDVELKVNDKDIPLNDIMEKMLNNIIGGFLKSIKGIPEDVENINININH